MAPLLAQTCLGHTAQLLCDAGPGVVALDLDADLARALDRELELGHAEALVDADAVRCLRLARDPETDMQR